MNQERRPVIAVPYLVARRRGGLHFECEQQLIEPRDDLTLFGACHHVAHVAGPRMLKNRSHRPTGAQNWVCGNACINHVLGIDVASIRRSRRAGVRLDLDAARAMDEAVADVAITSRNGCSEGGAQPTRKVLFVVGARVAYRQEISPTVEPYSAAIPRLHPGELLAQTRKRVLHMRRLCDRRKLSDW